MDSSQLPPARLDHDTCVRALREEADRYAAALEAGPLDAPVAACPGWDVAGLIAHVGSVHRWATRHVTDRATGLMSRRNLGIEAPAEPGALVPWAREGADELIEVLSKTPGDTPVWNWVGPPSAWFWSRRQLHETAMHRVDVELARGPASPIDTAVALDGIDELLALVNGLEDLPGRLGSEGGPGRTIHLHATDGAGGGDGGGGGEWTITTTAEGFEWTHDHTKGDVAVRATASDLLQILSNRLDPAAGDVGVFGDAGLLRLWTSSTAL
ncbi:MAG TPA: maleylpyruvate isomerase family mycothiol-dependent enzyme [Acidimicrobiales bacterium]|jgi:uncharacterized protein (TIGR03083 family)|nr:maleylpyruvate isomerase family mycothiol-dependent enzyme [Acidimicrobiales bacterium]